MSSYYLKLMNAVERQSAKQRERARNAEREFKRFALDKATTDLVDFLDYDESEIDVIRESHERYAIAH